MLVLEQAGHENKRVFGLDLLRAVAILLVLAAHTWPSRQAGHWANAAGILGVELFFVLSGYLIGGILFRLAEKGELKTWRHLTGFWRRRWMRTLPNYYLFLMLYVGWRRLVLGFPDVAYTNWEYFVFLQNFSHEPSFFFPDTWSLAVEEWFYLLFAFFLCSALVVLRGHWMAWVLIIGIFLIVPAVLRGQLVARFSTEGLSEREATASLRQTWDAGLRRTVILRLDIVMYGVVAAVIAARRPGWWQTGAKLWIPGLLLTALGVTSIALNFPLDRGHAHGAFWLWPWLAIGFALLLPRCSLWRQQAGSWAQVVRIVAQWSYALYLCHGLVLIVLWKVFDKKSFFYVPKHSWLLCLMAWIFSFAIAGVVYRWFERPIMERR